MIDKVDIPSIQCKQVVRLSLMVYLFHATFLLGLFFEPEDGSDVFLSNVG
jgi:hypothetical protein